MNLDIFCILYGAAFIYIIYFIMNIKYKNVQYDRPQHIVKETPIWPWLAPYNYWPSWIGY